MKIPAAEAVDQEWERIEKIPSWDLTKVSNKNEVIAEARNASLMDLSSQELEVGATLHFIH